MLRPVDEALPVNVPLSSLTVGAAALGIVLADTARRPLRTRV